MNHAISAVINLGQLNVLHLYRAEDFWHLILAILDMFLVVDDVGDAVVGHLEPLFLKFLLHCSRNCVHLRQYFPLFKVAAV